MIPAVLLLLSCEVALVSCQGFGMPLDIPIFGPLGGLKLTPGPDGKYGVGLHSGLNIGGNGFEKEINFVGGPGTFETGSTGGILVGGKSYGPNSQFGASRNRGLEYGALDVDVAKTKYQNPSNMLAFGGPQPSQQPDWAQNPANTLSFGIPKPFADTSLPRMRTENSSSHALVGQQQQQFGGNARVRGRFETITVVMAIRDEVVSRVVRSADGTSDSK
ncbi:hypothetical protein PMAYCL1PPCAC_03459 [Pristionchus mayeri]|uniref:Secreted protein n=1 Tax=Pristionchus mayeri TaxID=1317129 RepID=A0AAN4Z4P6_9BILA|nr:hypothetical protein PMAYCL1PPCAC_03455 [Pristionchus mayeri]GMR33264.1 hypothetical protein PMAYCL1PPCAC_03459 [Pristionchus mayeri]